METFSVARTIKEKLESQHTRRTRVPSGNAAVIELINARVLEGWSPKTWKSYSSTWNQFRAYAALLDEGIPIYLQVMMFIEDGIRGAPDHKGFSVQTGHQYMKNLSSILHT